MNAKLVLGLLVMLALVPFAAAIDITDSVGEFVNGSRLIITDVDVKVDGSSDKNLEDGDDIGDEAGPGSKVSFTIEVANIFEDNSSDVEIEDIEVTVTIEGIDDDDDIDEESKEFDVKADDDKKVTVDFTLPIEIDDGDYDVLIEVDGSADDNPSQEARMTLSLEVEKEDNEVRFVRNDLTPSEIKCSRTVQLSTSVINTGTDEEDEASVEVTSSDLGVNFREVFDLSDDPFDDDSKYRKTFTFTVSEDVRPGIYTITSTVFYDNGGKSEVETADLVVGTCALTQEEEAPEEEEEEADDEVVVVQPPQTTQPETNQGTAQPVVSAPTLQPAEEESLLDSPAFLTALIIGEVLLVILAIVVVVAALRRRS